MSRNGLRRVAEWFALVTAQTTTASAATAIGSPFSSRPRLASSSPR
jgi:hypothetical protein